MPNAAGTGSKSLLMLYNTSLQRHLSTVSGNCMCTVMNIGVVHLLQQNQPNKVALEVQQNLQPSSSHGKVWPMKQYRFKLMDTMGK